MSGELTSEILEALRSHGNVGCGMGELVDTLCAGGHRELEVELAIWELLRTRRIVPHGFVARRLRHGRSGHGGGQGAGPSGSAGAVRRCYEFVLIEGRT